MYTSEQGCVHLVILKSLCHRVASNLHVGHLGHSMLESTIQSTYWPGMEGGLQYHTSFVFLQKGV